MTDSTRSSLFIGCACALAATVIWSGNFIVARDLGDHFPPVRLAFLRWLTAALAVLPFGLRAIKRDRAALVAHLPYVTLVSVLGVTLFNTLLYIAGHHTSALNLALISTFMPVFILGLSALFLGENPGLRGAGGAALAIVGVVALITHGEPSRLLALEFNKGDLWMLSASLLFAVYSLLVRRRPADISPMGLLATSFLLGVTLLAPWALWEAQGVAPGGADITMRVFGSVLYIGLGASLAAFFCWTKAVETVGPATAGMIYYTLPLFSGIEASLLLGEPITMLHVASGACIIGGIVFATRRPKAARAR